MSDSGLRPPAKREVNLTGITLNALDRTLAATDYTPTEVINRAIQLYALIEEVWRQDGTVLLRAMPESEIQELRMY